MKRALVLFTLLLLATVYVMWNRPLDPLERYERQFSIHLPDDAVDHQLLFERPNRSMRIMAHVYERDVTFSSMMPELDREGVVEANYALRPFVDEAPLLRGVVEAARHDIYERWSTDEATLFILYKADERLLYTVYVERSNRP